jgi:hypothetical protein
VRRECCVGRMSAEGASSVLRGGEEALLCCTPLGAAWFRQNDSYVLEGGSFLGYKSKSDVAACVRELMCWSALPALPCMSAMAVRGDAMVCLRPCSVDVDDVGDPVCEARDSTSSMEFDCHPLLTLTMAYESRVRNSDESCGSSQMAQRVVRPCSETYLANPATRSRYVTHGTRISRVSIVATRTRALRRSAHGRRRLDHPVRRPLLSCRQRAGRSTGSRCRRAGQRFLGSSDL